jgi:RimJ/RimL family protein N-acetyltransferase
MTAVNEFGQPIGEALEWSARPLPTANEIAGEYCRLELLNLDAHADDLFAAHTSVRSEENWTYIPVGPFETKESFVEWVATATSQVDPRHYAVIDNASNKAVGSLSLMRHDSANGVIEVGYVLFSPLLQRTRTSTEAQYLLMKYVFDDLGYRRYEWKCDSLNEPSQITAKRLGFTFEGIFRNHLVYKGRKRDTAWYSITAAEWPAIKLKFASWLNPNNFDGEGNQKTRLGG